VRIVMVTDDGINIDRRILLQANTLMSNGHEVILLARDVEGAPKSEIINGLKLERLELYDNQLIELGYKQLAIKFLPTWVQKFNDFSSLRLQQVKFFVKGEAVSLKIIKDYCLRAIEKLKRSINGKNLSKKQFFGQYFTLIGSGAFFVFALIPFAISYMIYWHLSKIALKKSEVFEPNIWDRAIARRIIYYDPDIIHAHDLPQLYGSVIAKRQLKVPLIYDAHEAYPEIDTLTTEQQEFLRKREARLIKETDSVYTVNPLIAEFMEKRYKRKPINVIMNATSMPKGFYPGERDDRIRKLLKLDSSQKIILFQGWMADVGRGLIELVQAMGLVDKKYHLVMIGYGDIELFKSVAQKSNVEDRVHFLEPVHWDELVFWSAAADVGIIPYQPIDLNHRLCSPNKLFEFIAARLPILANDLPFLKQIVEGEGFGIVRQLNTPENIAYGINEIFDNSKGYIDLARRNMAEKGARYEWPSQAEKLMEIYRPFLRN
jgi:glycosyltransferase involved in cell wall biosynthesis